MEKSAKELKNEYQYFLNNISKNLDQMENLLSVEKLTFSPNEIEKSYRLYFENYKNPEKIGLSYHELEELIYTYWGEAFMHHKGGEWALNLSKTDKAYGTPTIEKWGGKDYPWSRISPKVWKIRLENGILGKPEKIFGK